MLDFPRWKTWLTILAVVFCAFLAVPSFLSDATKVALSVKD